MKRRNLTRRSQLESTPPFNVEELRSIFEQRILRGKKGTRDRWIMPTDEALERLVDILNNWHAWFYEAQEQRKINEAKKLAEDAFNTLRSVLPTIWKPYYVAAKRGDPFSRWQAEATIRISAAVGLRWDEKEELFRTDEALMQDGVRVTHREAVPYTVFGWQWLIDVIPNVFKAAMATTNSTPVGISGEGPLDRFNVAVVPLLTGEELKKGTSKRRFAEHRQKAGCSTAE